METPSLLLILLWRKKNRLPAVCPLLQNLRERRKNVPLLEGFAFFRFQSEKSREVFLLRRKLNATKRYDRAHLKAMNCNRGQLFRPDWVSSARRNSWAKRRIIHLKIKQKLQWKKITVPPSLFIRVLIHFEGSVTYIVSYQLLSSINHLFWDSLDCRFQHISISKIKDKFLFSV